MSLESFSSKPTPPLVSTAAPQLQSNASLCTTPICNEIAQHIKIGLAKNHQELNPCDDFDAYTCNGWRETHHFEQDQSSVNPMSILSKKHQESLRMVLENTYPENIPFTGYQKKVDRENFQRLKFAYDTCMNEDEIKEAGITPLTNLIDEFEKMFPRSGEPVTSEDLTRVHSWLLQRSLTGLIGASTGPDPKNPDLMVILLNTPELSIPKQQYNKVAIVTNLTNTVADMLQVLKTGKPIYEEGLPTDHVSELWTRASQVVQLEKNLSKVIADPEIARELDFYYQVKPLAFVESIVPELSWTDLWKDIVPFGYSITPDRTVIVRDLKYYAQLSSIIKSTSRETIHDYLEWRLISKYANNLHQNYTSLLRAFNNARSGRDESSISSRWRICIQEVDRNLGYLLGAAFIQLFFPKENKDFADRIILEVKDVFKRRFDNFEWMSNEVKVAAAKKVSNVQQRVGYQTANPDNANPVSVAEFYSDMNFSNQSYFSLQVSYLQFQKARLWKSLLSPTDINRWTMTPPTVNANFMSTFNAISFPAGILQMPFFSPQLPEYVSYGSFGTVAGHELSHAFDSNGAKYDEHGAYRKWWDNGTMSRFMSKTKCFVDQYQQYTVFDEEGKPMNVNGKLTLRENIADAGGVSSAYAAWKQRNEQQTNKGLPGLEEFTNEQLFFLNFAARRCGKSRPAEAARMILTDPHSPTKFRITGTLENSAPFKEAFKCASRTPKCEIW